MCDLGEWLLYSVLEIYWIYWNILELMWSFMNIKFPVWLEWIICDELRKFWRNISWIAFILRINWKILWGFVIAIMDYIHFLACKWFGMMVKPDL